MKKLLLLAVFSVVLCGGTVEAKESRGYFDKRPSIEEMKKHEENKLKVPSDLWEDFICFKKKYYNKEGQMFYIDRAKYYPLMEDMLEIIHKSDGLAFIAHIYEYGWMKDKLEELKNMISKFKIDGVECYYSKFTNEEINSVTY